MTQPLTLSSLPLFPLGSVLFPGGLLALRVFEVRYLDMVRKCHQAGAPFGVVALTQGREVRQAGAPEEQFNDVGTLAVIEQIDTPQPGLITLLCRGSQRFRITQRSHLPHGLWIADVGHIDPDLMVPIPQDLRKASTALAQVLHTLKQRDPEIPTAIVPTAAQLDDCGWVANRWCELLPVPLELKQRLMELDNPLVRLELVGDVLERTGIAPTQ
ncbi:MULTISPECIES: LON peptidase substrate-binding domain-containing protein [Acidovorax]|jgi:Lon protease-like protein|uniref:LON peptidase substrate-binding domain-containing protein n=1 Tax=Acidovorax facilis TaxID=12917 RepID=A0ABV8D5S4_9BURK|nr:MULTISPECIES: LON peptidase substrate-binding domain-containing protein [Acidovorax]KQB57647.1 peptidase S16 [Acidovorax sp. SD340]MBO1008021.1 LON peptidase substrate-binding domain-containing protein [Acidovorax sp. SD340]MCO4241541.1 LON peptidase substrate-binding domain-containing protein [Acidovorax facilis]